MEGNMTESRAKDPLMKRLVRWIIPDKRVANRRKMPPVIGYLGQLRASKEYKIGDISVAGFYMITEERWVPGSAFPVTLERTDSASDRQTLTVYSTVVRTGADGVAFTFLPPQNEERRAAEARASVPRLDLAKLAHFMKGLPLSEPNPEVLERA
jgi:hypothetical protein